MGGFGPLTHSSRTARMLANSLPELSLRVRRLKREYTWTIVKVPAASLDWRPNGGLGGPDRLFDELEILSEAPTSLPGSPGLGWLVSDPIRTYPGSESR